VRLLTLQRRSIVLTRIGSWTGYQRSLLSISGIACRFNRYDERYRPLASPNCVEVAFSEVRQEVPKVVY
jgi:hypothetical protein